MFGLSGVIAIVSGLAKGQKVEHLELTEFPNMPFLYWLAIASAVVKPKWTDSKTWPALKVIDDSKPFSQWACRWPIGSWLLVWAMHVTGPNWASTAVVSCDWPSYTVCGL